MNSLLRAVIPLALAAAISPAIFLLQLNALTGERPQGIAALTILLIKVMVAWVPLLLAASRNPNHRYTAARGGLT